MAQNKDVLEEYKEVQDKEEVSSDPIDDELAKYLKDKNYKQYFNSAIQSYNRSQLLNKHLKSSLNASGFGSQGYGATIQASNNNALLNEYAQIQNDFNNTNAEIEADAFVRKEEEQDKKLGELTSFIQNAQSQEELNSYLKNYGILNEDGSYNFDGLNESQISNLKSQIDFAHTNLGIGPDGNATGANKVNDLLSQGSYNNIGVDSYKQIKHRIESGLDKDGQVYAQFIDGQYKYMVYSNGALYEVDQSFVDKLGSGKTIYLNREGNVINKKPEDITSLNDDNWKDFIDVYGFGNKNGYDINEVEKIPYGMGGAGNDDSLLDSVDYKIAQSFIDDSENGKHKDGTIYELVGSHGDKKWSWFFYYKDGRYYRLDRKNLDKYKQLTEVVRYE